jgi:hypothetical protein
VGKYYDLSFTQWAMQEDQDPEYILRLFAMEPSIYASAAILTQ